MTTTTDFKPVRPTAAGAVDAFLAKCHPGSRKLGSVNASSESGFAAFQEICTVSGESLFVYLDCPPSGGWRVCAYARHRTDT